MVDWYEVEQIHNWEISLVDEDGHPVLVETPEGDHELHVRGEFEVAKPEGLPAGSPVDFSLAINMGPLPLENGRRYSWRLAIDGNSDASWSLAFSTRPIA